MTAAATPAGPGGSAGSAGPAVGDAAVQKWYLQAVVRVYGPWTVSETISARERALAIRRVRYATDALADLEAQFPRTKSGTWKE